MSKDVDRNLVFKTTRVRTALKNDGSWIHSSKQEKEEQDKARMDCAMETKPAVVRQKSYVLSAAKKFESVDSPLSPTRLSPPKGDSANQATGESIPPQADAQPDVATVETTDDTKPQAPTEEPMQTVEAQPETAVANTAPENKEEHTDTPVSQSNVEDSKKAAEVSADVCVELAEQLVANTTAEDKGECADTTAELSNAEDSEAKVSADAHVEDPVAETTDVIGTGERNDPAEVPAAPAVELKSQEESTIKTEPANEKKFEDAGVESTVQPAEGSGNECPPEHTAGKMVEAVALVVSDSLPDMNESSLPNNMEPVPDLLVESVTESPTQCTTETATDGSCDRCVPEKSTEEIVEAVAEVVVESSPETPPVNNETPEDAAVQGTVEPILDTASESLTESAVMSVESEVECQVPAEPVLDTRTEEVVECQVQPVNNTVVEQSAESAPENAADHATELIIQDTFEHATSSETAVQDKLSDGAIELTDASHVESSTAEDVPEPVEDPKESHSEESKPIQSNDTNNTERFQRPSEQLYSKQTRKETSDGKALCSFCDQIIDGNVKITLSEPLVTCHPDCLKCFVCAKVLGDMLTPMFLHDQVIHCDCCFAEALKA